MPQSTAPAASDTSPVMRPARRQRAASDQVRVGLVVSLRAGGVRTLGPSLVRRLGAALGDATRVHMPHDRVALRESLRVLLDEQGVNVVAIAGGDGTLHVVTNELTALHARDGAGGGGMPVVFVLGGGTLNLVGNAVGTASARPDCVLSAFVAGAAGQSLGKLRTRALPVLRVHSENGDDVYGFVFGSEMVRDALELYDSFGGGYAGLSRFLFETARGYAFETKLWRSERWRLQPPSLPLSIVSPSRTTQVAPYAAVVASTIDVALGRAGIVCAVRRSPDARGFHARAITETRVGPLLRMIPGLMTARSPRAVVEEPEAISLHLHGGFTLDGERYGRSDPSERATSPLRVELATEPLLAIAGRFSE